MLCFAIAVSVLSFAVAQEDPLADLAETIPGTPGEDYPIFSQVPETSFLCDGQVDGGYYADQESDCQAFHICSNNGNGGLTKYSFLCPNGTLFNQEYFICDWWFNVDCSLAESLYSLNDDIAAEREANNPENLDVSNNARRGGRVFRDLNDQLNGGSDFPVPVITDDHIEQGQVDYLY